jgi:large subunit ribosomal protein L10
MRAEKQYLLDEIDDKIENFESFIVARYEKLSAADTRTFRREIAKLGSEYEVVRKRVFLKAAQKHGIVIDESLLEGHIGVVFSKDEPMETAKAIVDFSKECGGTLEMVAGHVEGKVCDSAEMKQIAQMPSKQQLRAQLLALLQAPMAQSVGVMHALLSSLLTCMDNKVKKES